MEKVFKQWFLVFLFVLPGITPLFAQDAQFTTTASSTHVGVGEPFRIQFTINNASKISGFQAPVFRGFEVLSRSQSQSTSIMNGTVSQSISYEFVVQGNAQGRFTIGAASARVDGEQMQSNPITITVEKGYARSNQNNTTPSAPNPFGFAPPALQRQLQAQPGILRNGENPMEKIKKNVFVKVDVDKTSVYVGQQITATYKLYTRLPTSSQVTKVPSFTGFSSHDIQLPNPIQPTVEDINGIPFKVFVIRKTMLFPLQSGNLELDPAEVDNTVRLYTIERQKNNNDPFDNMMNDPFFKSAFGSDPFFQQAFGESNVTYHDYNYNTSSEPIAVHVKPLPESGKPADFTGAVGRYTINATLDKTNMTTDDAATLKVTISGTGNIVLLSAPQLDLSSDFENYSPTSTDNINANSNPYGGSRTFSYVLMPKVAGNLTVPPVKFSYFDPSKGAYKTIETSAFTLDVTQGNNNGGGTNYGSAEGTELQPIRNGRLVWNTAGVLGFGSWWYWLLLIIPIAALVILYFLKKKNDTLQSNQVLLKNKRANKVALKRLSLANRYLQKNDSKEFYGEISQAVWGYLCDKLDIPFAELSKQKAQEKLLDRQVNGHTPERLFELLDNCEMALYAGTEGHEHMEITYRHAIDVITNLEGQLKN